MKPRYSINQLDLTIEQSAELVKHEFNPDPFIAIKVRVLLLKASGKANEAIAKEIGRSRVYVSATVNKYRKDGIKTAIAPFRFGRNNSKITKLTPAIEKALIEIRKTNCNLTYKQLVAQLETDGFPRISVSTIGKWIHKLNKKI